MVRKLQSHTLLLFIASMALVAVVVFVVQRHMPSNNDTARNTDAASSQQAASPLPQTDKAELSTEDQIVVAPSPAVTAAEVAMPEAAAPTYQSACEKMKQMYVSEYDKKVVTENQRYESAKQAIINKYSSDGMAFSAKQKTVQAQEQRRHDLILKSLQQVRDKQLAKLTC